MSDRLLGDSLIGVLNDLFDLEACAGCPEPVVGISLWQMGFELKAHLTQGFADAEIDTALTHVQTKFSRGVRRMIEHIKIDNAENILNLTLARP